MLTTPSGPFSLSAARECAGRLFRPSLVGITRLVQSSFRGLAVQGLYYKSLSEVSALIEVEHFFRPSQIQTSTFERIVRERSDGSAYFS